MFPSPNSSPLENIQNSKSIVASEHLPFRCGALYDDNSRRRHHSRSRTIFSPSVKRPVVKYASAILFFTPLLPDATAKRKRRGRTKTKRKVGERGEEGGIGGVTRARAPPLLSFEISLLPADLPLFHDLKLRLLSKWSKMTAKCGSCHITVSMEDITEGRFDGHRHASP